MTTTADRVLSVISEALGLDTSDLHPAMTAQDVDGWDSLSHVTIILMLSREFGFNISAVDAESAPDIGALIAMIDARL